MTAAPPPAAPSTAAPPPAPPPARLGPPWLNRCRALIGTPSARRLARAALRLDAIRHHAADLAKLTDEELCRFGRRLRGRARGGEPLDRLLPETFGAGCAAVGRVYGIRPHDVQLAAGIVMQQGAVAELATGEGKTLTAVFPTILNALPGKGAHVVTVNDYLARRDAEWTRPVYEALGMSVGILQSNMPDQPRHDAYQCDVTYATASEFAFDFLRRRLKTRETGQGSRFFLAPWSAARAAGARPERGYDSILVDEADNIFIDEARTPLIISGAGRDATEAEETAYRWADAVVRRLGPKTHYEYDEKKQQAELTADGRRAVRWSSPPSGRDVPAMDKLYEHVERALLAHVRFRRDQHYLVEEGKVVIIDEGTGRRMPDRHWSGGIHQAVEAKEGLEISVAGDQVAHITYQTFFRLYKKLLGMTGTIYEDRREIATVYKLPVVRVPTNRPPLRQHRPDRVFPTEAAKFDAVAAEVAQLISQGRAVLIGTRSVERSEMLSERLTAAGIGHQVLSARHHDREAGIVSQAGQPGSVMIATNMAGRGTDVKLAPSVAAAGGLHVLGTERHESIRIDRQLEGRAGRQGDPGSCQFFLSLEDELLEALGPRRQAALRRLGARGGSNWQRFARLFAEAQRRLERQHRRDRAQLQRVERERLRMFEDLGIDPYLD